MQKYYKICIYANKLTKKVYILAYVEKNAYLCTPKIEQKVKTMYRTMKRICVLLIAAVVAASCVTQKQLTYLSDADAAKAEAINASFQSRSETVLRTGDALTIFVSALDKEAVTPYNLPTAVYTIPGTDKMQTTPSLQYYVIDADGNVSMPVLGKVHVAGLTCSGAENAIGQLLAAQVVGPSVQVRLINAKVSVLGEVTKPGQVMMTGNRLTILEALAAAGDLTPFGRRDNVLVTREVNGKMEIARVNLRSADLYNSPYYYLQQNDVVYISPNKVRAVSSTNAGLWVSIVGTALSAATVIVTVVKK